MRVMVRSEVRARGGVRVMVRRARSEGDGEK